MYDILKKSFKNTPIFRFKIVFYTQKVRIFLSLFASRFNSPSFDENKYFPSNRLPYKIDMSRGTFVCLSDDLSTCLSGLYVYSEVSSYFVLSSRNTHTHLHMYVSEINLPSRSSSHMYWYSQYNCFVSFQLLDLFLKYLRVCVRV